MKSWQRWAMWLADAGLVGWAACAVADEPARATRNISEPFNEVRLIGDFDLELIQSDTTDAVIEAAREDLPNIRSAVENGELTLKWGHGGGMNPLGWFSRHPSAHVSLSVRAIDKLVLDGSGSIHAGAWTHHALDVRLSGSGDVKFDHLSATRFTCELAGSGSIVAAGSSTTQKIRISGSGNYRAPDLRSQTASVSISGSGDVELWAERTLDAHIAGSGDIRYYGSPTVTQSVSGSGSVTSLGAKSSP